MIYSSTEVLFALHVIIASVAVDYSAVWERGIRLRVRRRKRLRRIWVPHLRGFDRAWMALPESIVLRQRCHLSRYLLKFDQWKKASEAYLSTSTCRGKTSARADRSPRRSIGSLSVWGNRRRRLDPRIRKSFRSYLNSPRNRLSRSRLDSLAINRENLCHRKMISIQGLSGRTHPSNRKLPPWRWRTSKVIPSFKWERRGDPR